MVCGIVFLLEEQIPVDQAAPVACASDAYPHSIFSEETVGAIKDWALEEDWLSFGPNLIMTHFAKRKVFKEFFFKKNVDIFLTGEININFLGSGVRIYETKID